jgi:hypothetical protein
MKNHTVSLRLAEFLKEAKWKKGTEFWWRQLKDPDANNDWELGCYVNEDEYKVLSAPLATEILEELPRIIHKYDNNFFIRCSRHKEMWCVYYYYYGQGSYEELLDNYRVYDKSLPDALAKFWLYLKGRIVK